jgi:uncharacterized protein (DUF2141 family)
MSRSARRFQTVVHPWLTLLAALTTASACRSAGTGYGRLGLVTQLPYTSAASEATQSTVASSAISPAASPAQQPLAATIAPQREGMEQPYVSAPPALPVNGEQAPVAYAARASPAAASAQHFNLAASIEQGYDVAPNFPPISADSSPVRTTDATLDALATHFIGASAEAALSTHQSTPLTTTHPPPTVENRSGFKLRVVVQGVRVGIGPIRIAVFDHPQAFPTPSLACVTRTLADNETQLVTEFELPHHIPVAVAVFQDLDGDGGLSRNRMGLPVEPFAFSNNPPLRRGPPTFAEAAVSPTPNVAALSIVLKLP